MLGQVGSGRVDDGMDIQYMYEIGTHLHSQQDIVAIIDKLVNQKEQNKNCVK